jgi:predicted RND superfamily exporter protein
VEEGTDFRYLWQRVNQLQATYQDANTRLYVTGYPMLYAWVQHYYPSILLVLGLTTVTIAVMLAFYFRTLIGVLVPLFSGLLSALWALGFAGLCGFHLDPLVLVVFVLITARALSHSVQSMERFHEEYAAAWRQTGGHRFLISRFVRPGLCIYCRRRTGAPDLGCCRIPVIQNLAFIASFWILTIAVSVITLHPVLLTFLPPPYRDAKAGTRLSDRFYTSMCRLLVWLSQGNRRYVSVVILILSLTVGLYLSSKLQVGTVSMGEALMYPDHPYTVAARKVTEKFIGTSQMIVIAEGKGENALKQESVLTAIEAFQWHMKQHGAAGSASATSTIKRVFRLLHEGDPNWEILPTRQHDIDTSFFLLSGSPELVRLMVDRYRNTPITVYYRQASNAEAKQAIATAKEYLAAHPHDAVTFRLAGGLVGILAAVQEEVEYSYHYNLPAGFGLGVPL